MANKNGYERCSECGVSRPAHLLKKTNVTKITNPEGVVTEIQNWRCENAEVCAKLRGQTTVDPKPTPNERGGR